MGRVYIVEDSVGRTSELVSQLTRLDRLIPASASSASTRRVLSPGMALDLAKGAAGNGAAADTFWQADDIVLLDCMDRDAPFEDTRRAQSSFFAIDILLALRARRAAGHPIPRVVAHSVAMDDEMMRATLGEFLHPKRKITAPGEEPVVRFRIDPTVHAGSDEAVLWAMFDRATLQDDFQAVLDGDRTRGLAPPGPESPVWAEVLPTSCLASFHSALRDTFPAVWNDHVVRSLEWHSQSESVRKGIRRLGCCYLEPNPERGNLTYRGYIEIARAIINPAGR